MNGFLTGRQVAWSAWVVVALVCLGLLPPLAYGTVIPISALLLALVPGMVARGERRSVDGVDLMVIGGTYVAVIALYRLAFVGFTQDAVAGLFLTFAAGMLLGVAVPVVYTVWVRRRSLATLGLRRDNWRQAAALGLAFAAVQALLTLVGYDYPAPETWVPLLVLSLTVGLFEAMFFRGFVQLRLEASFGPIAGVGGAALMYALYHVGYGMGSQEMIFLLGLGVAYAVAFAIAKNLLVIWPLLTPIGGFFATMSGGDITMPWAAILGFADVLGLMALVLWLASKRERKQHAVPGTPSRPGRPHPVS